MEKIIKLVLIFCFLFFCNTSYSQLNFSNNKVSLKKFDKFDKGKSAGTGGIYTALVLMAIINPMLVIENKKAYFGLTKEVSAGVFPLGRLAFEYSYIFRNYSKSQLRFSYNYDIALQTNSDFMQPLVTPGIGYFTDTNDKGVFVQLAIGLLLPVPFLGEASGLIPYFRIRNTFVRGDNRHNILDFSIGMSFVLFYGITKH